MGFRVVARPIDASVAMAWIATSSPSDALFPYSGFSEHRVGAPGLCQENANQHEMKCHPGDVDFCTREGCDNPGEAE